MRKLLFSILVVAIVAAVVATPAQAQGNKFKIYAAAVNVAPLGSEDVDVDEVVESVEASSEVGWEIGFEWRFGKWAGLQFDYLQADHDVEIGGTPIATTGMAPLSASLNFHVLHSKYLDLYVGPTVSYVDWDDIQELDDDESVAADSEFAYGLQVGLDISVAKSVAIVTGLRYTKLDITPDGEDGLSIDPLYAKAGVAFRW
jgi:outer membrane protein W